MNRKTNQQFIVPVILLIYIAIMAYISYPRYKTSGDWGEYFAVIGISVALVALLFLLLKRKQKIRDRFTRKD
jgi:LPXTG-motif cell wall-anchored protein